MNTASITEWALETAENLDVVYLVLSGSRAQGTADCNSDYDIRGVYVPPLTDCLVGFDKAVVVEARTDRCELVLQPIHKFLKLCWQSNPNILDWLFVPNHSRLHSTLEFRNLLHRKGMFLTSALYAKFRGYATSHFQKMERGLTRDLGAKRKKDIEQFGYSVKNAMHMIRLLRMGCEALEDPGTYNVYRLDAKELLEIRAGTWTLESVKAEGNKLLKRLDLAYDNTALAPPASREEVLKLLLPFWGH